MQRLLPNSFLMLILALVIVGCASTQLSNDELNAKYPEIIELQKGLDMARADAISLLSPDIFQQAHDKYLEAYIAANGNQADVANSSAKKGLELLKKASQVAEKGRDVFSEVLTARKRALQVQANQFYPDQFKEYEEALADASKYIEDNKIEKAKNRRQKILSGYSGLELKALKKNTIAGAQAAIARAEENDAEKFSPRTLANAREELVKAKSTLDVDRTALDKANAYAKDATILANRSYYITLAIKDIDKRDLSYEDIILRHQNDVARLGKVVSKDMLFDKDNSDSIGELTIAIQQVVDTGKEQTARADDLQQKVSELVNANEQTVAALKEKYKGEIDVLGKNKAEIERMQREQKERLDRIQSMFSDNEANVFQQKNNVLISVHGFKFPSGSAEIRPDNFDLMNRIVSAIKEFKGSNVVISGHTDSTGTAAVNKSLSNKRAESVAKFFVDVAGMPPGKIEAQGYGQEKPVASNQSAEGRAKNRRVEILIVNQ